TTGDVKNDAALKNVRCEDGNGQLLGKKGRARYCGCALKQKHSSTRMLTFSPTCSWVGAPNLQPVGAFNAPMSALTFETATQQCARRSITTSNSARPQWRRPALALARSLETKYAERTSNRDIFIRNFSDSQDENLASLEKATGKQWTKQ